MLTVNALKRLHVLVSFELADGECIALQGPSGVGKSLLLRAIADLDPSEGSVELDGMPREAMPAPAWRKQATYVAAESGVVIGRSADFGYNDLIPPALLVVMNGALSLALHLNLERQLALASVRMVVQLVLVGYVLTFLFAAVSPFWTALAAGIMVLFASREIVVRQKQRLLGLGLTAWAQDAPCSLPVPSRCFHFSRSYVPNPGIIRAMLCRCFQAETET